MIEVKGFQKTFYVGFARKSHQAAVNISFEVGEGEIFGFLGPNGAGKTTTIKALLGLIRPDNGTLRILGHEISSMAWRSQVGYMPEHPNFYDYLTGFELVSWFGRLSGLSKSNAEDEAKKHLDRVGLSHAMHRRMRGYSKGMFQRAGLAQSLIGSPKLLILDEPMGGLDPIGRKEIRELILSLNDEGRTVFYSTHILPDVEMTCDRVSIIHKGRTKRTGRLEDILTETTRGILVSFKDLPDGTVSKVKQDHPSAVFADGALNLELEDADAARAYAGELLQAGGTMLRFEPHRDDLESIFVKSLDSEEEIRESA